MPILARVVALRAAFLIGLGIIGGCSPSDSNVILLSVHAPRPLVTRCTLFSTNADLDLDELPLGL